jgi:hypothetical protein
MKDANCYDYFARFVGNYNKTREPTITVCSW